MITVLTRSYSQARPPAVDWSRSGFVNTVFEFGCILLVRKQNQDGMIPQRCAEGNREDGQGGCRVYLCVYGER